MARVLIVDDEPSYQLQIQRIMERDGYEARTAGDVVGAVESARSFRPDLLIVDYMLQDELTGLELLERLRDEVRGFESILITGYPSPQLREQAQRAGVVAFLEKPFGLEELRKAAGEAVGSPGPPA